MISHLSRLERPSGLCVSTHIPPRLIFCTLPLITACPKLPVPSAGITRTCRSSNWGNRGYSRLSCARACLTLTNIQARRVVRKLVIWLSLAEVTALTTPNGVKTYPFDPKSRPAIPERVETPIFTMTRRKNAFTVFGLIFMRAAISLLVRPWTSSRTVSISRSVKANCCAISPSTVIPEECLSSKSAKAGALSNPSLHKRR